MPCRSPYLPSSSGSSRRRTRCRTSSNPPRPHRNFAMRDLIGVGLALFLGVIGIFFAYGVFGSSNSNSQIQETFLELQQARTELSAYANQNGGYGSAAFTNAQIVALQLLPSTALAGGTATDQWKGAIALTGNNTNFYADYA